MGLSRETLARAQAILDNGFAAFIGDGLAVEIAGRRFIGPINQMETQTTIDIDGKQGRELSVCGQYDSSSWRYLCTLKPAQALAQASGGKASRSAGRLADRARSAIKRTGAAGSAGRVAALRSWYAVQGELAGQSAFDVSDDDIAAHCAQVLAWETTGRFIDEDRPTKLGANPKTADE
jgi:hypothetical protein